MRPLEWVVLLSFIPIVAVLAAPAARRGIAATLSAILPLAASVTQIVASGWRVQMIPLYVLALLIAASQLPALFGHGVRMSRRWQVAAAVLLLAIVLIGGMGAGWVLPIIELPRPTGPYAVGIVDRELVDDTRQRRLMVSVWYPAQEAGPPAPLTRYPDEVMAGLGDLTGLPDLVFQHLRYVSLTASEGVPLLQRPEPFPVLIFSHGLTGMRLQNSSTLQELASWGYVVVAIDHTGAAAVTVFPDGEAAFYDETTFGIPAGGDERADLIDKQMFPVWVADQRFVYDVIETWQEHDPVFGQKLDLAKIGSFGHSFGGATSLEVCRVDARCQAAVDMDGGLYGAMRTESPVRPMMLMTSPQPEDAEAQAWWEALFARANVPAYWLELPNSSHISFTISELLSPLLAPAGFEPRDGLATIDRYLRAFFDRYLLGEETLPLGPSPESTDVLWRDVR